MSPSLFETSKMTPFSSSMARLRTQGSGEDCQGLVQNRVIAAANAEPAGELILNYF